jgi:hypothetical protein
MHATGRGTSFINPFLHHPPVLYFIDTLLALVSSFSHLFSPVQSTAGYQIEKKRSAVYPSMILSKDRFHMTELFNMNKMLVSTQQCNQHSSYYQIIVRVGTLYKI